LAPGDSEHANHECFPPGDDCYLFNMTFPTMPTFTASFAIADFDDASPSISGGINRPNTEDVVKTTFCIVKGRFDAVPSPSPTVSTLPTLLPTPKPTLVPSSLPTVIPSFPPTVSPSLPPTPSPTLTPTSGPTVNCYPGYYVNSNGACTICDVGKVSNTSLPPWPTEC